MAKKKWVKKFTKKKDRGKNLSAMSVAGDGWGGWRIGRRA